MNQIKRYFDIIGQLLEKERESQKKELLKAANLIAECIKREGLIYIYGSGHAHMSGEELFYRAGGLGNVYPVFIEPLMLHEAAVRSSQLEKEEGYLTVVFEKLPICEKDLVIIVSTSGRNAAPIDAAMIAEKKGAGLITLFSREYSLSAPSGHSSGKRLMDFGDARIDNGVPAGDACLIVEGIETKVAPVSTIVNLTILQSVTAEAVSICADSGFTSIPIFESGNMEGGMQHNESVLERYRQQIPFLK